MLMRTGTLPTARSMTPLTIVSRALRFAAPTLSRLSLSLHILAKAEAPMWARAKKRDIAEAKKRRTRRKDQLSPSTTAAPAAAAAAAGKRSTEVVLRVGLVVDTVTARRSLVRIAGFLTKLIGLGRGKELHPALRPDKEGGTVATRLNFKTIYTVAERAVPEYSRDPADAHSPQRKRVFRNANTKMTVSGVDGFGGIIVHAGQQSGGAMSLPFPHDLAGSQAMIEKSQLDVLVFMGPTVGELTYWLAHARLAPVQIAFLMGQLTTGIEHTVDYLVTSDAFVSMQDQAVIHAEQHATEQRVVLQGLGTYLLRPSRVRPPYPYKVRKEGR